MVIPSRLTAVVAAVAAAMALAACSSGTAPTPTLSPSVEPSASAAGSPVAEPAEPSADPSIEPSDATLVVQLHSGGEVGPLHQITILDDGRVISSDPFRVNPPSERRLTAEGVQLVRDAMAASGLTGTSATYMPVANPGKELVYGGAGPVLYIGQAGADPIVVTWYLFADTELDLAAPQPEAETLDALAARLTTLEDWLPTSAWTDASAAPFEPDRYLMSIDLQPRGPDEDGWVEASTVSWPLEDGIDVFGQLSDPPIDDVRYGCMDAAEGGAVIGALESAGAGINSDRADLVREFVVGDGPDLQYWITVSPILDRLSPSCD